VVVREIVQDQENIDRSIATTEEELTSLNAKRAELIARLRKLRGEKTLAVQSGNQISLTFRPPGVTNLSSEEERITLFHRVTFLLENYLVTELLKNNKIFRKPLTKMHRYPYVVDREHVGR